jgi:hypothetical protein
MGMSVTTMDVDVGFRIVYYIVNENGKSEKLGNQSAVDSRGRAEE